MLSTKMFFKKQEKRSESTLIKNLPVLFVKQHSTVPRAEKQTSQAVEQKTATEPKAEMFFHNNVLNKACIRGDTAFVCGVAVSAAYLLDKRSGFYERTPLHCAVINGHLHIVNVLFLFGEINPNTQDRHGKTALHHAVYAKNLAMIEYLLNIAPSVSLNLNLPDKEGKTPLHHAASDPDPTIYLLLLKKGADPTLRDDIGRTPVDLYEFTMEMRRLNR